MRATISILLGFLLLNACRGEPRETHDPRPAGVRPAEEIAPAREERPAVAEPAVEAGSNDRPGSQTAGGTAVVGAVEAAGVAEATTGAAAAGAVPPDSAFEVAGVAAAMRTTRLSMKAGGILRTIKVREGTWVKANQPMCALDTIDLAIRTEAAEVAHKQALAGVQSAEQDLRRARELFKGGALTDQGIEKAELALTMAKLSADAAGVALRAAQQALADATLRAPFAGVVTKVLAEEGTMVTTMPPSPVFVLVDTSTLEVRVPIPERLLAQVKVGEPVMVRLPAINLELSAKVDRIPEVIDPATRSVEAVIRVDNRERRIPAGLYARVRFAGVHPEHAALIPEDAGVHP